MDQLISQITQQTGISQGQAQQTVQIVMGFLRDRLPPQLASQVESHLLGGQTPGGLGGQAQQTMDNIGGMFGQPNQPS